jgi:hypothetical protein
MGASRPFRQALKCGEWRIAPGGRRSAVVGQFLAESDRDGPVIDDLDAHPGAEYTASGRNSRCREDGALGSGSGVEDDGHRAVVDQFDLHPCSEDPGLDRDSEVTERLAELLIQGLGHPGARST